MRRLFSVILLSCLTFCFLLAGYASAEDRTYHLNELGLSITFPDNYIVVIQDESPIDSRVEKYGLTEESIRSYLSESGIHLDAWDENVNHEIVVTMSECAFDSLDQIIDNDLLDEFVSALKESYKASEIECIKTHIASINDTKYIKVYIKSDDGSESTYSLQYMTIVNKKSICITMHSGVGEINNSQESVMKELIGSIQFDADQQHQKSDESTQFVTYTDDETGLTFNVPGNWEEVPVSEEHNTIKAKFEYSAEGLTVTYGSTDVWVQLSEEEKTYYSRDDINNSILTKADIAEMTGCEESEVLMVTIDGKEYYNINIDKNIEILGITVETNQIVYMRYEHGYLYMFQFVGNRDRQHYSDFEKLMDSVVYPKINSDDDAVVQQDHIETVAAAKQNNSTDSYKTSKAPDAISLAKAYALSTLLNLVITIAVYSLPIVIYRYAVRREPVERSEAKWSTILYGIFAFVIMQIIKLLLDSGGTASIGAILLWSGVNYRILIGGKKSETHSQRRVRRHPRRDVSVNWMIDDQNSQQDYEEEKRLR